MIKHQIWKRKKLQKYFDLRKTKCHDIRQTNDSMCVVSSPCFMGRDRFYFHCPKTAAHFQAKDRVKFPLNFFEYFSSFYFHRISRLGSVVTNYGWRSFNIGSTGKDEIHSKRSKSSKNKFFDTYQSVGFVYCISIFFYLWAAFLFLFLVFFSYILHLNQFIIFIVFPKNFLKIFLNFVRLFKYIFLLCMTYWICSLIVFCERICRILSDIYLFYCLFLNCPNHYWWLRRRYIMVAHLNFGCGI